MLVKANQSKRKEFKGVEFDVLAIGQRTMLTKMRYKKGDFVPFHGHPNEQSGYVSSGKYRIRFSDWDEIIEAGDSYSIPENVEHSIEVIEPGEIIEAFTPVREEYL